MRLESSSPFTFDWQDRSPLTLDFGWTGAVQNDPLTVRFGYTVPAGRRAWIGSLQITTQVITAGPAGSWCRALATIRPAGSALRNVGGSITSSSALASVDRAAAAVGSFLAAGDRVEFTTVTSEPTAVVQVFSGLVGMEFDA